MKFFQKIASPYISLVVFLGAASLFIINLSFNSIQERYIQDIVNDRFDKIMLDIKAASREATRLTALFVQLETVRQAYTIALSGDIDDPVSPQSQQARDLLRSGLAPLLDSYAEHTGTRLQLHFHLPNGRSLARLWRDKQTRVGGQWVDISDDISSFRRTVMDVNRTGQVAMGVELGGGGIVTRGVLPVWDENGRQIGSAEVLQDFNPILTAATGDRQDELLLYVNEEQSHVATALYDREKHPNVGGFIRAIGARNANVEALISPKLLAKGRVEKVFTNSNTLALVLFPLHDYKGESLGVLVYVMDVSAVAGVASTARVALLITLTSIFFVVLVLNRLAIRAKAQAEAASMVKGEFLSNISHEIRTPMNAIMGMTELIMHENAPSTVHAHAADMRNACRSLIEIIDDVLDISKIESGKLEIMPTHYYISTLLTDVIAIIRTRADNKGISFVANIDSSIPSVLYGDAQRVKQILINLLSNAVKFTHEGQIRLAVSGTVTEGSCKLTFAVEDTGVGIKPEDMKKIFLLFQQVDAKRNRNIEGTGLGLSISRRLAEMMGGSLEVESTFGVGSTFTVTILQNIVSLQPLAEVKHRERHSVLVYENRPAFVESIKFALETLGCHYKICSSHSKLQNFLNDSPYGYIFISSLYIDTVQDTVVQTQPEAGIVVLNAEGNTCSQTNVLSVSMPIHCLQIASILNGECGGYGNKGGSTHVADIVAPKAKVLVVDDNAVNLKVAVGLLNLYEIQADTAFSGLNAVEMVRTSNYDLIFMDHMMPEMDGIDTTVAIRGLGKKYTRIPIVALTANAISGVIEMFKAEGLNDFLAKPIEMAKLDGILKKWLPENMQQSRTAPILPEETQYVITGVDTKIGIQNAGGSIEYYIEILTIYVTDCESRIAELEKYHREGATKAFTICIHALKSSSANIGAGAIADMAMDLEAAGKNKDIGYINATLRRFTDSLALLLKNIQKYLNTIQKKETVRDKAMNVDFLKAMLGEMEMYLGTLDLESVESMVKELGSYQWSDEILAQISAIEKGIAVFDYDTVEAAVVKLKVMCATLTTTEQ